MKNVSEIYNDLLLSSHEIATIFERTVHKEPEKSKSAIPYKKKKLEKRDICDTFFYLAGVKYKIRLNSWNTKYSQDVTCTCKNVLSVNHTLLKCPITTVISEAWVGL